MDGVSGWCVDRRAVVVRMYVRTNVRTCSKEDGPGKKRKRRASEVEGRKERKNERKKRPLLLQKGGEPARCEQSAFFLVHSSVSSCLTLCLRSGPGACASRSCPCLTVPLPSVFVS